MSTWAVFASRMAAQTSGRIFEPPKTVWRVRALMTRRIPMFLRNSGFCGDSLIALLLSLWWNT